MDNTIKSEYIFYDVASDRPFTIQEEKIENIGAGDNSKLVIRYLNVRSMFITMLYYFAI